MFLCGRSFPHTCVSALLLTHGKKLRGNICKNWHHLQLTGLSSEGRISNKSYEEGAGVKENVVAGAALVACPPDVSQ